MSGGRTKTLTKTKETELASSDDPKSIIESEAFSAIDGANGLIEDKEMAKDNASRIIERDLKPELWKNVLKIIGIAASVIGGLIGTGGIVKLILNIKFQNTSRMTIDKLLERGIIKAGANVEIDGDKMKITIDTRKA